MARRHASTSTRSCTSTPCTSLRRRPYGMQPRRAGRPQRTPPTPSWKAWARFPSPTSGGLGPSWTSWTSSLQSRARCAFLVVLLSIAGRSLSVLSCIVASQAPRIELQLGHLQLLQSEYQCKGTGGLHVHQGACRHSNPRQALDHVPFIHIMNLAKGTVLTGSLSHDRRQLRSQRTRRAGGGWRTSLFWRRASSWRSA